MNAQFKKGVLELIVLVAISENDRYGYEVINVVKDVVDVNEGTIYPLLKRLTNEKYFETYLQESTEGPPRKYYHLTSYGEQHKNKLKKEWFEFSRLVKEFIEEVDSNDEKPVS